MKEVTYDRGAALRYAQIWALRRNPAYIDFEEMGGDCTNFASQCIYAGSRVMNPKKVFGWYYYSSYNRSPSWSGVQYLYNFLIGNQGVGPYASNVDVSQVVPGDIVQLGHADGTFYHSPVVVGMDGRELYVAAHTFDAYMRPLSSYEYDKVRYIHIDGVREW